MCWYYNLCYPFRAKQVHGRVIDGVDCEATEPIDTYKIIKAGDGMNGQSHIYVQGVCPLRDDPVVFNQNTNNVISALNRRAFAPILPIDDDVFNDYVKFLPGFWKELFPKVWEKFEPSDFDSWNSRFLPAVREKHSKCFIKGEKLTARQCKLRDCFLKQEETWDREGKPRLITGVSDNFKIRVGPYLYKLSKVVGSYLTRKHVYAPGKNMLEIGAFYDPKLPSVCTDMSRFDSCVTDRHMRAMLSLYKHFHFPEDIVWALEQSIEQILYFRDGMMIEPVVPRRSSGHPNTTLENTLLNLSIHVYSLRRSGVFDYRIMVGGDDCIIQGLDNFNFCETLKQLGFITKAKVCEPYKGTFYSGWFLPVAQGIALTPKIGRQLSKLGMSTSSKDTYVETVTSCRAIFSHIKEVLDVLDCTGIVSNVSVKIKPNYLLAPEPLIQIPETLITLEIIYPYFLGILNELKRCYKNPPGVWQTINFQSLLDEEE